MRRAMRRFVSKLQGKNKYIFFMVLILICIVSLSIGIYIQFFYKYVDTDPLMLGINIGAKKTAEEYDLLKSDFNNLFNNKLKSNSDNLKIEKIKSEKEVVYTAYNLVNQDETFYSVDAQIPIINIDSKEIEKINSEIKNEYYNKANNIMRQTEGNTIYKVSYTSFVNSDIISLVIKVSLKEEGKSEKVTIKTYTYSINADKLVSMENLIELKKTTKDEVQKNINKEIKKSYDNAKLIAIEYGNLYVRDLESDIYKIENINTYFLTDEGYVYIIYPYGNDSDTNEMDIVIF